MNHQYSSGAATAVAPFRSSVAFEQYRLGNGLEVILCRDHKAPIVHVLLWYHVGSKNERNDRTGFAHLFEHMMFQGSENVGKTEHFSYVQGVGGTINASTSQDRTNYYQTLPREYMSLGLWLEADRMRALSVTDENFQNQLSVVKEERKQRYDNRPYGLSYLTMLEMLFGGSQYGWGPIGDMAHLDAAPLETVREFHRRYYTPGNATLVVCGDFEPEEARRLVEEQFGDIPAGEPVPRPPVQVKQLGQQVRRTIRARVPLPSVYVGFQSAPITHRDAPALGVLSIVLDRGRSSRLNRSLVYGSQSAQDAQAFNLELEHAGMFLVQGTAAEGVPVERVEEEIWTQLELIRESGIEERELRAVQNYIETILVTSLWRLSGVADMLARYHVLCGDASRINSLLDEYRAVTVEDVRRVANLYLRPDAAAVLHYLPEELSAS